MSIRRTFKLLPALLLTASVASAATSGQVDLFPNPINLSVSDN